MKRMKMVKDDRNPKQANYGHKGPWDHKGAKNPNGPIKYRGAMVKRTQKGI